MSERKYSIYAVVPTDEFQVLEVKYTRQRYVSLAVARLRKVYGGDIRAVLLERANSVEEAKEKARQWLKKFNQFL